MEEKNKRETLQDLGGIKKPTKKTNNTYDILHDSANGMNETNANSANNANPEAPKKSATWLYIVLAVVVIGAGVWYYLTFIAAKNTTSNISNVTEVFVENGMTEIPDVESTLAQ